jgi:hypothetical protein
MKTEHEIFRVCFKVRPTVSHPRYFNVAFGYLDLYLAAANAEDAIDRAEIIISQLPYELATDRAVAIGDRRYFIEPFCLPAFGVGFSLCLTECAVGMDEPEDFETEEDFFGTYKKMSINNVIL